MWLSSLTRERLGLEIVGSAEESGRAAIYAGFPRFWL